jgi:hypothetical protein
LALVGSGSLSRWLDAWLPRDFARARARAPEAHNSLRIDLPPCTHPPPTPVERVGKGIAIAIDLTNEKRTCHHPKGSAVFA